MVAPGVELKVTDYRVRSVTGGLDAQGEASVEVELDGRKISGRGVDTNVIAASAMAFLQVINRVVMRALSLIIQSNRNVRHIGLHHQRIFGRFLEWLVRRQHQRG